MKKQIFYGIDTTENETLLLEEGFKPVGGSPVPYQDIGCATATDGATYEEGLYRLFSKEGIEHDYMLCHVTYAI